MFLSGVGESDPQGKKIISMRLFAFLISVQHPAEAASLWPVVSSLMILISLVISMPESETCSLDSPDGQ